MKTRILIYLMLLATGLPISSVLGIGGLCNVPDCPEGCGNGWLTDGGPVFRRTYARPGVQARKQVKVHRPGLRSPNGGLVITKDDFEAHLALDKSRTLQIIPLGAAIPMDVKGVDEEGTNPQVWDMPDFSNYAILNKNLEHVTPESSGFTTDYPTATHCIYNPETMNYEMFELTDDDLFDLGLGLTESGNPIGTYDMFLAVSPVPLEWDLLYEGIVTVIYTDDPDYDSTVFHQYYDVVAFGTLNTYDDGPTEALKLFFTEEISDYKDGEEVEFSSYDEIVWYSKDGHFLRGSLEPGAPWEGVTTFAHMEYQKIAESTSTKDESPFGWLVRSFPNPVHPGQDLNVVLPQPITGGRVDILDAMGVRVGQIVLAASGEHNQVRLQVPDHLPAGLYTYRVMNEKEQRIVAGKVILH